MVLNELGQKISAALAKVANAEVVDDALLDLCLKDISTALLQADVNVKQVLNLRNNVKTRANSADKGAGLNKRKIIEKAVVDELGAMLDSGVDEKKLELKKGQPNVVMFVGLQGCGKTTTCSKYGAYYKKKQFKSALVCADTFRAGAFDQLKQNATKTQIPFYGSYTETDPATIAQQGVEKFRAEKKDLIIVDTSGRHKQQTELFEEMRQVAVAVKPTLVVFVMDGSIGQAAFDQAKAFKDSVEVGAVIMTKMDGHAKGGGALGAVAATKSPIIFIGTGEHMHEFEQFNPKSFVSRILGKGDWGTFVNKIQDVVPEDQQQEELMDSISKGNFSMRILYEQLSNIQKMGPVGGIMSMIPGLSNSDLFNQGREKESQMRIKRFMCIMDSMTDKELDSPDPKLFSFDPHPNSRVIRVAKGSGSRIQHVADLLEEYKRIRMLIVGSKGRPGMAQAQKKMGNMRDPKQMQAQMAQMSKMLPPHLLQQMGGPAALEGLMKQMESGGGIPGMMGGKKK